MNQPRPIVENEFDDLMNFLDSNLRPQCQWSLRDEYPSVFNTRNLSNILVLKEDSEQANILSHAAIKPLIVRSPAAIFKIAAIGSVVTDPAYRRQGLSQRILDHCLSQAVTQNCDFAILWTNLYDFYRKQGFELAGQEIHITFDKPIQLSHPEASALRFQEDSRVNAEALLRLYTRHTVHSIRSLDDVKQFLKIPNSKVYTAWTPENQLAAYAVEGKGADLPNYVHEWGGKVSHLLALFNFIYQKRQDAFHILVPSHAKNLLKYFENQQMSLRKGYLGMIKITHFQGFVGKVRRAALSLGIEPFSIQKKNAKFEMVFGGVPLEIATESELVQLIFGPQSLEDKLKEANAPQNVLKRSQEIWPLPLWLWGWDSI